MQELNARVAMWQTYVQTATSDSDRAESINRYMAIVQIAIFSGYFVVAVLSDLMGIVVGAVGVLIGLIWLSAIYRHMLTHRTKLKVIADLEQILPFRPITQDSAMMNKAVSPHVHDATSWNSYFSCVQMLVVGVLTVIHWIAVSWFGWLHILRGTGLSYSLDDGSALFRIVVFGLIGLVGLVLLCRSKQPVLDSLRFWLGLIMTAIGLPSLVVLIVIGNQGSL